jgi:hypothetical protein
MPAARRRGEPLAIDPGVRILHRGDDTGDLRLDQRLGAGGVRPKWLQGSSVT